MASSSSSAERYVKDYYCLGDNLKIPLKLHSTNRQRLVERLREDGIGERSIVMVQGGQSETRYCSDNEPIFRQESYFHWAFGVLEPDYYGAIEVDTGRTTLFAPLLPEVYAIISGSIHPAEFIRERYAVDEVIFYEAECGDISNWLTSKNASKVLTLHGLNTDSGNYSKEAEWKGKDSFSIDNDKLHKAMSELRVIKTELEIDVLRFANLKSCDAHMEVMRKIRPGWFEYQAEALFKKVCYSEGGMRHVGYTCICGTGHNGSVLHYGHAGAPNDKKIEENDMCLFDMGGEYFCYGADITCSYPASGKFSDKQKIVYQAVLEANQAVFKVAQPGVCWLDMHKLAEKIILVHLKRAGLLQGDVDEMMEHRFGATFMPHGLGHFIGIDTHDVGGYPDPEERSTLPGLKSLRTARVLKAHMVVTIEPGCYFINVLLDRAMAPGSPTAKFCVPEVLNTYRGFGGVRLEDGVVIRYDKNELLSSTVPRTIEDIEAFMKEGREDSAKF